MCEECLFWNHQTSQCAMMAQGVQSWLRYYRQKSIFQLLEGSNRSSTLRGFLQTRSDVAGSWVDSLFIHWWWKLFGKKTWCIIQLTLCRAPVPLADQHQPGLTFFFAVRCLRTAKVAGGTRRKNDLAEDLTFSPHQKRVKKWKKKEWKETHVIKILVKTFFEAVHSVALWTQVTLQVSTWKICTEVVHSVLWTRLTGHV